MEIRQQVEDFLSGAPHAVVGASLDRSKYGNKVLRCYLQHARSVHVVHPSERAIEGVSCVASIAELPEGVHGLSLITPPAITERAVAAALAKGIRRFWMQPGAESAAAISAARAAGASVIAGGPCLLVSLGYRE
ncbi:MAG: CoA-binding protein [Planctomycetes bacterium]|nr:CoA-binding protein [Planctomycetota bacterium]